MQPTAGPSRRTEPPRRGAAAFELAFSAVLLLGVLLVWVAAAGAWDAFSRTPWLDECVTLLIAGDPSARHGLAALYAGIDSNPPTFHALVRAASWIAGGLTPTVLRSFVFASAWLALIGTYGVLRRAFAPGPSWVGVLVVAGHALVVHHAFDGRYYTPWLACTTWFCLALPAPSHRASAWRAAGLAFASVLLCTIHYFGVVTWALALAGDLAANRASPREWLRERLPALAGPAALSLCIPLYLGQRSAYSAATWVPPLGWEHGSVQLERLALPLLVSLAVVAAAAAVGRAFGGRATWRAGALRSQLPMAALVGVPVVLALFSWFVQPTYMARYALPFTLAGAPAAAALASGAPRAVLGLAIAALLAVGASATMDVADRLRAREESVAALSRVLEELPARAPVLFAQSHDLYPICFRELHASRGSAPRACAERYALFDSGMEPGNWRANLVVISREMAELLSSHYGGPAVRTRADLARLRGFFFVATRYDADVLRAAFPHFEARQVAGRVVWLERTHAAEG